MKKIVILGSTGSIGQSALEVISSFAKGFRIIGLCAHSNVKKLVEQVNRFRPKAIALFDITKKRDLETQLKQIHYMPREIFYGADGIIELARLKDANFVISSLVGASGLMPTIEAIKAKKTIALANKEVLVMAGDLVMSLARENHVQVLPIDSEHSGLFQCVDNQNKNSIRRVILTASGGPYLKTKRSQLNKVTVEATLRHPTWKMGPKVTVDSATLMNKAFEVIEAHHLFGLPYSKIDILLHPQSIIHALVEYIDGSTLIQASIPDMKIPIQFALTYPRRAQSQSNSLRLEEIKHLDFLDLPPGQFPCFEMALEAGRKGGTIPAVVSAANEIAVESFLTHRVEFLDIEKLIDYTLSQHRHIVRPNLRQIMEADAWARSITYEKISAGNTRHSNNVKRATAPKHIYNTVSSIS